MFMKSIITIVTIGTDRSPSEGSRCSSSLGYLEPRPHDESENKETPKMIQKKLLETVNTLNTGTTTRSSTGRREEKGNCPSPPDSTISSSEVCSSQQLQKSASSKQPSQSVSALPSTTISRSQSNQSLDTAAASGAGASGNSESSSNKGRSLGSFFRR